MFTKTAEVLREPHVCSQATGCSKLASRPASQIDQPSSHWLDREDRRLLPEHFKVVESLSGKKFTLDAAANDDNAHCAAHCDVSNSFMKQCHTGHIWINAPFTSLTEFVQH